jgi:hypothetical protein
MSPQLGICSNTFWWLTLFYEKSSRLLRWTEKPGSGATLDGYLWGKKGVKFGDHLRGSINVCLGISRGWSRMDQAAGRSLPTDRNLEFRGPPTFCLTLESVGRVHDRVVDLTCFDGSGASSRKFYCRIGERT